MHTHTHSYTCTISSAQWPRINKKLYARLTPWRFGILCWCVYAYDVVYSAQHSTAFGMSFYFHKNNNFPDCAIVMKMK